MIKIATFLLMLGFLAVGVLLFTGHAGFAIRVANYVYFLAALLVLANIFDIWTPSKKRR